MEIKNIVIPFIPYDEEYDDLPPAA